MTVKKLSMTWFLMVITGYFSGCARPPRATQPRIPDVSPLESLDRYFVLQQSVRFDLGPNAFTVSSVIVNTNDNLEILMLSPFGVKLMHIRYTQGHTDVLFRSEEILPVDPEYILRDIMAMLSPGCLRYVTPPPPAARCRIGSYTFHDEFLAETLVRRTVTGTDYSVDVVYGEDRISGMSKRVELINSDRGYRITALLDKYRILD